MLNCLCCCEQFRVSLCFLSLLIFFPYSHRYAPLFLWTRLLFQRWTKRIFLWCCLEKWFRVLLLKLFFRKRDLNCSWLTCGNDRATGWFYYWTSQPNRKNTSILSKSSFLQPDSLLWSLWTNIFFLKKNMSTDSKIVITVISDFI